MNADFTPKDMYKCFFTAVEGVSHMHTCNACQGKTFRQILANGYANLKDHLDRAHEGWKDTVKRYVNANASGPLDAFIIQPSQIAKNMHSWISWVIDDNLPFTFVESKSTRANSAVSPTSVNTLKKYMRLLKNGILKAIRKSVPATFGLIIDGWTSGKYHYFAIYITWYDQKMKAVVEHLIFFDVGDDVDDETEFVEGLAEEDMYLGISAADWFDIICDVLNEVIHGGEIVITLENFKTFVEFMTMDNCSANKKLSRDTGVPMIGCASHRLHLDVIELLGTEEKRNRAGAVTQPATGQMVLVKKIDLLMGELSTLKNSSLLRTVTKLQPERRNKTRWYSIFKMLIKWNRIRLSVLQVQNFPPAVTNLIPSPAENVELQQLIINLEKFEGVSKILQGGGDNRVSVGEVRALFDRLVGEFDLDYQLSHIRKDATIINNKHFENGIAKIQDGLETTLSAAEKAAVKIFLKPVDPAAGGGAASAPAAASELSYAQAALNSHRDAKRARLSTSKYRSTEHVASTSNIVERANSSAKLSLSDLRKSMKPETLHMIMFLKHNRSLWPNARFLQAAMDSADAEALASSDSSDEEEGD